MTDPPATSAMQVASSQNIGQAHQRPEASKPCLKNDLRATAGILLALHEEKTREIDELSTALMDDINTYQDHNVEYRAYRAVLKMPSEASDIESLSAIQLQLLPDLLEHELRRGKALHYLNERYMRLMQCHDESSELFSLMMALFKEAMMDTRPAYAAGKELLEKMQMCRANLRKSWKCFLDAAAAAVVS